MLAIKTNGNGGVKKRKMLNICVPVLNRYDLLARLFSTIEASSLRPDNIYVIDNGGNAEGLIYAISQTSVQVKVHIPQVPMGVAEAWNWFIDNVPEDRLITNDDIVFGPDSLKMMSEAPACFVSCDFGFACFILRNECIERVGRFDETISPGYAYFEDRDYYERMKLAQIKDIVVHCDVKHDNSQTIAAFSPEEMAQHHRKFLIAQANFLKKWGELPSDLQVQT